MVIIGTITAATGIHIIGAILIMDTIFLMLTVFTRLKKEHYLLISSI